MKTTLLTIALSLTMLSPQQPPDFHRLPEEPDHDPEYRHWNWSRRDLRPTQ